MTAGTGSEVRAVVGCLGVGGWLTWKGWGRLRRSWAIANLPTSRVRSVAMGMAELKGKAKPADTPLSSPVSAVPCVWYRVRLTREHQSGNSRRTRTLLDLRVGVPFLLEDDTGRILVDPDGAECSPTELRSLRFTSLDGVGEDVRRFCALNGAHAGWFGGTLELHEWALLSDAPVYVLGEVGLRRDPAAERGTRVTVLLRQWLGMPDQRARFDANRDGVLQPEEWDAARAAAQDEVRREELAAGPAGPELVVRKPRGGYFLLGAGDERAELAVQRRGGLLVAAGLALLCLGVVLLARWLPR